MIGIGNTGWSCDVEQLRGLSQEGSWWIVRDGSRTVRFTIGLVENSESTVASSVAAGATAANSATTTAESATKSSSKP